MKFFREWLINCLNVKKKNLVYRLAIHETADLEKELKYWRKRLDINDNKEIQVFIKKHKPKTNRKNKNNNYHGLFVIRVKKSTDLNRKIWGWILALGKDIV